MTNTARPLRVLIADDHPLMVAGIRHALDGHDDIEVVGEARSGPEVIQLIERRRPTHVLLDLHMPGVTGTECIAHIASTWPEVKTVVLSASENPQHIDAALAAGASAYVVKSVTTPDLAAALRQVSGGCVFHAGGQRPKLSLVSDEPESPSGLTDRERQILDGVAAGKKTSAIAQELWVSEHTVKFHLTNIYRKLGVANRAGAVRHALARGLVAA